MSWNARTAEIGPAPPNSAAADPEPRQLGVPAGAAVGLDDVLRHHALRPPRPPLARDADADILVEFLAAFGPSGPGRCVQAMAISSSCSLKLR